MKHTICAAGQALLRMAPAVVVGLVLLGSLQLWTPGVVRSVRSLATSGPVYTVAALRAHLAHDPHGWVGRPLWVQGLVVSSVRIHSPDVGSIVLAQPHLIDPVRTAVTLPLLRAGADPLWRRLRRLPLLARLLPSPQRVQWGTLARYRIVLRAEGSFETPGGYGAVLLDAT
jgi:hypothetical protein